MTDRRCELLIPIFGCDLGRENWAPVSKCGRSSSVTERRECTGPHLAADKDTRAGQREETLRRRQRCCFLPKTDANT